MSKFTLLEIHLDGAEFTANTPGGDALLGDASDDEPSDADDGSGAGLGLAAVLALVVLVAAAVAAKKFLGGEPTDDSPLEDR